MSVDDIMPADFGLTEHFCAMYRSDEERLAALVPFVHQGLILGEKVVYIADTEQGRTAYYGMRLGVLRVGQYMATGQFEIVPPERAGLAGDEFDPVKAAGALKALADRSLSEGCRGLRVAAEMSWINQTGANVARMIAYEEELNGLVASTPTQFMCLYDSRRFDPYTLLSAFYKHPAAFVGSEPYDNFHFRGGDNGGDIHAAALSNAVACLVEKRAVEEGLAHRVKVEDALSKASKILISGSKAGLVDVLEILGEAVGANRAYLLVFDGETSTVSAAHEWYDDLSEPSLDRVKGTGFTDRPWIIERLLKGEDIVIGDVDAMPSEACAEKAALEARGARASVTVPVRSPEGALLAAAGFDDTMGTRQWAAEDLTLLRVAGEMFAAFLGRLKSEAALKDAEERNTTLIENMRDLVFTLLPDGSFASLNHVFETVTGMPREEWLGKSFEPIVHGEDAELARRMLEWTLRGEQTDTFELRVAAAGGAYKYSEFKLAPLVREGTVVAVIGVARDITERKRNEEALRESEANYRAIFESANDAIIVYDAHTGAVLDANHKFCELLKCESEDVREHSAGALYAGWLPYSREDVYRWMGSAPSRPQIFEWLARTKTGEPVWIEVSLKETPIGGQRRLLAVMRDISERKRAEEELRNGANFLSSIIDQSPIPTWISDADGTAIRQNEACRNLLGIASDDETVGKYNLFRDGVLSEAGALGEIRKVFTEGRTARLLLDYDFSKVDMVSISRPTRAYLMVTIFAIKDAAGRVINAVVQYEDMTERKRLEEMLRQSQKMEAVGRLAGGVAHDFNNLLAAIMGYSDLVLAGLGPSDRLRGDVEEIKKAVDRATELTRQLLTFSRKQAMELKAVDLNAAVAGMEKMLRLVAGSSVQVDWKPAADLAAVKADGARMEQVIMNLVSNARDAMPDGGWLTISTANVELDQEQCREFSGASPGQFAMLAVGDTGVGMDAETRSHMFEPFFTTKGMGKGTGLGLATVYGIIKQSGGVIAVSSEPGKGTTVKVYLPRFQEPTAPTEPRGHDGYRGANVGAILLVEDEEIIREFVGRLLAARGYTVLKAASGEEALGFLDNGHQVDLLLTDVTMPGMDGRELARRVTSLRPQVRVLYVSGFTANSDLLREDSTARFLQKPFTSEALLREVEEILQS